MRVEPAPAMHQMLACVLHNQPVPDVQFWLVDDAGNRLACAVASDGYPSVSPKASCIQAEIRDMDPGGIYISVVFCFLEGGAAAYMVDESDEVYAVLDNPRVFSQGYRIKVTMRVKMEAA